MVLQKVFNFPRKEKQDMRKDFFDLVKHDLNVELGERDVVEIHRLLANYEPRPLIVKLFNSDEKKKSNESPKRVTEQSEICR